MNLRTLNIAIFGAAFAIGFGVAAWPGEVVRAWRQVFPAPVTVEKPKPELVSKPAPLSSPTRALTSTESLSRALAMPAGRARDEAMKAESDKLQAMEPAAALQLLLAQAPSTARDKALLAVYRRLAIEDLETAVAWAEREPFLARLGSQVLANRLGVLAATDGRKAWGLYQRWRAVNSDASAKNLIAAWMNYAPAEAATFGLALPSGIERTSFLNSTLGPWIYSDSKAFLAWAKQQPDGSLLPYLKFVSPNGNESWATLSDLAQVLPNETVKSSNWSRAICYSLEKVKDLSQLPNAIRSMADPELRDQNWAGFVMALAERDPAAAQGYLTEIQDPAARSQAMSTLAAHLAASDPLAALALAAADPAENVREFAQRSVLATWMGKNPTEALAYMREHAATINPEALDDLVGRWSSQGGTASADWAMSLSDAQLRTHVLNTVAGTLVNESREAALTWARTHAGGGLIDEMLQQMGSIASRYYVQPEMAVPFLELIQSPKARQAAAETLLASWRWADPTGAQRWHDQAVQQGRIAAVPVPPAVAEPAFPTALNAMQYLQSSSSEDPRYYYTIGGRSYQYHGRGLSFPVYY